MPTDASRHDLDLIIARIEKEAYDRGWADAAKHIMSTAAHASAVSAVPFIMDEQQIVREPKRRSGYGVIRPTVREALAEAADRGTVPADIVAFGRQRGDEFALSSVRSVLRRMKEASEVRNERGRWFLVQPPRQAAGQDTGDAATSPADESELDDGGDLAAA